MTRILLVRHGHVEGIEPVRFRGRSDTQLTSLGRTQALRLAARLQKHSPPAFVYTSPMSRCVDTGTYIATACTATSATLGYLNDLDYGNWQWLTHAEVKQKWPEEFEVWRAKPHLMRFPGGESLQDLVCRTADALRYVLDKHANEQRPVVLVGHDSVNRALLIQLLDQPLSAYWRIEQSPCAINEFDVGPASIKIHRVNDTAHLEEV
ncbi:histidine phosphatase family protein [Pandoraea eparura]|nr:histidine phosphatase family protein [Pandoraea eparura]